MNEQQPFEAIRKSDEAGRSIGLPATLVPCLTIKSGGIFIRSLQKR